MATLNASKWGHIVSSNYTTHAAARGASSGFTATVNPTTTQTSIAYRRFTARGRGNNFYQIRRSFYYFDTSGITGTVSSATLNIRGGTGSSDVIVVASTAFSGDGSTNIATSDYGNVAFSTLESNAYTSWTNSNNSITLLAGARTKIQNNNAFIVAVLQYNNDQQNVDSIGNIEQVNQTNFATTAYLDYAVTAPSDITSLNGIARASITSFNTIALASIDQINGIDN